MKIQLFNAGKRFNRDWIFRNLNYTFEGNNAYVITGSNGSGKSTLLQAIAASSLLNEGKIEWQVQHQNINSEKVFQQISICAPYLELIEEFTLIEFLNFHQKFKPFAAHYTIDDIISIIGLETAKHKKIAYYSSGMKQRVKLAQCVFGEAPIVLLDEPCTNLDKAGFDLYNALIQNYCQNKLIIVSSNDPNEYRFCTQQLHIQDYK